MKNKEREYGVLARINLTNGLVDTGLMRTINRHTLYETSTDKGKAILHVKLFWDDSNKDEIYSEIKKSKNVEKLLIYSEKKI